MHQTIDHKRHGRRSGGSAGKNTTSRWSSTSLAATSLGTAFLLLAPTAAGAMSLYNGSESGNNLQISLTTTLSYTGQYRVNPVSQILAGPSNANGNDGDANFRSGIAGSLFEVVPVLNISDGDYGAHFSGQLYLNTSYLGTNQNNQASTLNSIYLNSNRDFTSATRNVNGENAQLLDAFVFGQHEFNNGQSLQVKIGRQTLFWGQSLFFATDGISGGQAPINIITAQDLVNPQAQQVFMPVGQAVLTYQPWAGLTIQGYYQFEWEHDYFQGAGAYFNGADYIDKGAQSVIAGYSPVVGNEYFLRSRDLDAPDNNGQFGLSVQGQAGSFDLGLFGLRFDSKAPEIDAYPGQGGLYPISTPVATGLHIGQYQVVYPRDVWLEGLSASTTVGAANVAGEISTRQHMPLVPAGFGLPTPGNPGNANSDPLYPVGDTIDAQVSAIYLTAGVPLDPGGVSFDGEVVVNHLLSVTNNRSALATGTQGTSAAFEVVATPTYFNVLPNVEVQFPIGITYDFLGRSSVDQSIYHGNGSFSAGVTATYKTWLASFAYQDFLGRPNTVFNTNADRGYVSLNLQYSF